LAVWKNYRLTPFSKPTDSDAWKLCIEKFNSAKKKKCASEMIVTTAKLNGIKIRLK